MNTRNEAVCETFLSNCLEFFISVTLKVVRLCTVSLSLSVLQFQISYQRVLNKKKQEIPLM